MDDQTVSTRPLQRTDLPRIAVAICTKDRHESLAETLDSIWNQTYLPAEVVVIDDGRMPDELWEQIAVQCQDGGVMWKYDRTDAPGLTSSRNRAASIAESEIIQYLDDDVTCDRDFLERVAELFADASVSGVTAHVREPKLDTPGGRRFDRIARLARWWSIQPKGTPSGAAPDALGSPDVAVRAKWMSGAAMAYRRDVVLENPFDERLAEYALGEDREMGYRLAPRHWLLESRLARVTHRRDASGRANPRRLGFMTGYNYLYILNKTCRLRGLRRLEPYFSLAMMALRHAPGMFKAGGRAHAEEMFGVLQGAARWLTESGRQRDAERSERAPQESPASVAPRTLRVAFVANRLEPGGAERMLVSMIPRLRSFGVEPIVYCLKDAGPLSAECAASKIQVREELLRFRTDVAVVGRLRRVLREDQIDAIVVSQSGGDRQFWSTITGGLTRTPIVVWCHWFPKAGERHIEVVNRLLSRGVDRYIAIGAAHQEALARIEQLPAGRIEVIPNAIDTTRFATPTDRTAGRQRLGLSEREFAVGLVANLRPEKRHDIFIAAAQRLARDHPDMRFFIVGDGPSAADVRKLARHSGLSERILHLLGPRNDVPEILAALDACCLCSDTECFSVTMLEAAAAGCPFIGPLVGAMGEFLKHGETGLAIRPADAASLADAISALHADSAHGAMLAENARAALSGRFELDRTAEAFAAVVRDVVRERSEDRTLVSADRTRQVLENAYEEARGLDCRSVV
ncbi:MAG TPA: glycosyltransferase [Phycisphaerae bacterium]|nr:glycosyltransferase [Phycisphaerae bacterium]HRW52026.1 glycosyltransferase [Phycisphaerae bacterium]